MIVKKKTDGYTKYINIFEKIDRFYTKQSAGVKKRISAFKKIDKKWIKNKKMGNGKRAKWSKKSPENLMNTARTEMLTNQKNGRNIYSTFRETSYLP